MLIKLQQKPGAAAMHQNQRVAAGLLISCCQPWLECSLGRARPRFGGTTGVFSSAE
jgi:hypothetical protein